VRVGIAEVSISTQEDTQMVKPTATVGTVVVTADGEGLVSHAGVALLVELADRAGLTSGLSLVGVDAGAAFGARSRPGPA
jgi:hypothetical protein